MAGPDMAAGGCPTCRLSLPAADQHRTAGAPAEATGDAEPTAGPPQ